MKALLGVLVLATAAWAPLAPAQTAPQDEEIVVSAQLREERSRWLRAETPNFIVYGAEGEKALRRDALQLERFDQLLRLVTGAGDAPALNKLPVYLLENQAQVERLRRQALQPGWFATGYYSAAPTGMLVAADTHWDKLRAAEHKYREVWLFTEYSRHFLQQQARGAYLPAWYMDGLSLYLSTTKFGDDTIEYGGGHPSLVRWLNEQAWPSLDKLLSGRLDRGGDYSALSVLLVHYIFADKARVAALERFLAAARGGAEPVGAFTAAFGMNMRQLRSALWDYRARAAYVRLTGVRYPDIAIDVATLPRSADRLLLDEAALRIGVPEADRQRSVLARASDGGAPGDDYGARVSAHAQILYGDAARADAILGRLLAKRPDDSELLYLKGMRHLVAGRADATRRASEYGEAKRWFARAHKADPHFYPALYHYAESLSTEPRFLSENTENVLLLAAETAPQATQILVTAANLFLLQGKFARAEDVLERIVVTPRDPASTQVPALLALARTGRRVSLDQLLGSFRYTASWRDLNCC